MKRLTHSVRVIMLEQMRFLFLLTTCSLLLVPAQKVLAQDNSLPGNTREDITWIQQTLNRLDYDCGTADGVMGSNTRSCIRAFQRSNDLETTGAVNEITYEEMLEQLRPDTEEEAPEAEEPEPRPEPEQPEPTQEPQEQEPSATEEHTSQNRVAFGNSQQLKSNTTGLYLRGYVSGYGLSGAGGADGGRGLGAKFGYGFSPLITGYLGVSVANVNSSALAYVDLGAQFNFRAGEAALVPYLDLALSGVGDDTGTSGSALTGGGGLKYFISPSFALDGGLLLSFISLEGGSGLTGARLNLGVSWFPF